MSIERAYNWIFGEAAWINFSSGNPVSQAPSGNQMSTSEGCDSVSDEVTGALLFYTDGESLWDASHALITGDISDGAGLNPNQSIQAITVVKKPLFADDYYLFMVGNWTLSATTYYPLLYREYNSTTKVLGSVVTLAAQTSSYGYAENLTSCLHANNRDVWIITKLKGNNLFRAWKVTPSGVSTSFITSTTSWIYNGANRFGQIKVAPGGRKIVLATGKASVGDGDPETLSVYNFDNETGQITNEQILLTETDEHQIIGCDFSIDGYLVYATSLLSRMIYKFNIRETPIQESSLFFVGAIGNLGAVQRGPDNRIYIAQNSQSHIIQITNSDDPGVTISTNLFALYSGTNGKLGLPVVPQIIDYIPRDYRVYDGTDWKSVCDGDIVRFWDADSGTWKTMQEGDSYYNQSRQEFETIQCTIPIPPPAYDTYPIEGYYKPEDFGFGAYPSHTYTLARTDVDAPITAPGDYLITDSAEFDGLQSVVVTQINLGYLNVIFEHPYVSNESETNFLIEIT
jgi:hypothetical protein